MPYNNAPPLNPETLTRAGHWSTRNPASLNLADGTAVASWNDLSGNNNHLVQATGSNQPIYRANRIGSFGSVSFESADSLKCDSFYSADDATDYAVVLVMRANAGVSDSYVLWLLENMTALVYEAKGSTQQIPQQIRLVGQYALTTDNDGISNNGMMIVMIRGRLSNGDLPQGWVRVNGRTSKVTAAGFSAPAAGNAILFGKTRTSFDLFEAIWIRQQVTDNQFIGIEKYLMGVYGMTPPSGAHLICLGNSTTRGTAETVTAGGYPERLRKMLYQLGFDCTIVNMGVESGVQSTIVAQADRITARVQDAIDAGKTPIIVVWHGHNSFGAAGSGATEATWMTGTFWDTWRTLGAKIVVLCPTPVYGVAAYEANWNTYCNTVVAAAAQFDGVVDFRNYDIGDSIDDPNVNAEGYYADVVHFTDAGYNRIADIVEPTILDLINTQPVVEITGGAGAYPRGTHHAVTASATDAESGDMTDSIQWTSDIQAGVLGSGGDLDTAVLNIGIHTLTATVTDAGGKTGSDDVVVSIRPAENSLSLTGRGSGMTPKLSKKLLIGTDIVSLQSLLSAAAISLTGVDRGVLQNRSSDATLYIGAGEPGTAPASTDDMISVMPQEMKTVDGITASDRIYLAASGSGTPMILWLDQ